MKIRRVANQGVKLVGLAAVFFLTAGFSNYCLSDTRHCSQAYSNTVSEQQQTQVRACCCTSVKPIPAAPVSSQEAKLTSDGYLSLHAVPVELAASSVVREFGDVSVVRGTFHSPPLFLLKVSFLC
ncbi:MAG: hypothetical protein HYU97_10540 [Deltaproteobacteria bacterium]|nr:hypothetical protein [Deltaproteobacteria bacterium]